MFGHLDVSPHTLMSLLRIKNFILVMMILTIVRIRVLQIQELYFSQLQELENLVFTCVVSIAQPAYGSTTGT